MTSVVDEDALLGNDHSILQYSHSSQMMAHEDELLVFTANLTKITYSLSHKHHLPVYTLVRHSEIFIGIWHTFTSISPNLYV